MKTHCTIRLTFILLALAGKMSSRRQQKNMDGIQNAFEKGKVQFSIPCITYFLTAELRKVFLQLDGLENCPTEKYSEKTTTCRYLTLKFFLKHNLPTNQ